MSDLKRIYVVEKFAASLHEEEPRWYTIHTTDNQDEAVRVCKDEHAKTPDTRYRVRQFWVESARPAQEAPKAGQSAPVDVPMVPFTCLDHRDRRINVYETARAPRCPDCRASMVPVTMAEAMDKELNP